MVTTASTDSVMPLLVPRFARPLFILNAAVAWCAVALSLTLHVSGYYVNQIDPMKPTILGNLASGIDTPSERFFDWITYFTIWSNVTVAVVLTVLCLQPGLFLRNDRVGTIWRTLRLDSVLMITVTGIIFNLLLAEPGKTGWDLISNNLQHVVNPILTVLVFLIAGPRGLLSVRTVFLALILPLLWVAFALIRGTIIGAYPYPFLDVATNGWASVLAFVVQIVIVGVLFSFLFLGIDKLILRLSRPARADVGDA